MRRLSRADAALLLGLSALAVFCSLSLLGEDDGAPSSVHPSSRRSLQTRGQARRRRNRRQRRHALEGLPAPDQFAGIPSGAAHPWAQHNLLPLAEPPHLEEKNVLFWHIPKSGGTTAKSICECLDLTVASRAGALPQFGHDQDEEILAYRPWDKRNKGVGPRYVNVDTTQKPGILRAAQLGLVPANLADVIFTSDPAFAIEHLFDPEHKGRVLGLFRHPVRRLVSKFFYLRVATWERTYHPQWKKIHLTEWAQNRNNDNEHMVKKLAGKSMRESVDEGDLQMAMQTVKDYFVVGLMDHMEESIRRFNVVLGVDDAIDENRACMDEYFGERVERKNANSHPKVEAGHPAWQILAEKNALDIRLYEYIVRLFEEQRDLVASYANPAPVPVELVIEEMPQEDMPREEMPQEETPQEEIVQEEMHPEEPPQEESLPEEALPDEGAVSGEGLENPGPPIS
ncbi:hypothetical protein ACHAXT_006831 [Thalassiosira profunda]